MDANKAGAWANIGNFFVGCFVLYLMWQTLHPSQVAERGMATQPTNSFPLAMWIFLGGLTLAGGLHLFAARIQAKQSHLRAAGLAGAGTQGEERIFVGAHVTCKSLTGLFEQHMTIEANRLIEAYIGKWMRISGTLRDIAEPRSSGTVAAHLQVGPGPAVDLASLTFDKGWVGRLSMLQKGSEITAVGQISRVSPLYVDLDHCELVPAHPE